MTNVTNITKNKPDFSYITEDVDGGFKISGIQGVDGATIELVDDHVVLSMVILTKEELFAFMIATPLYDELVEFAGGPDYKPNKEPR